MWAEPVDRCRADVEKASDARLARLVDQSQGAQVIDASAPLCIAAHVGGRVHHRGHARANAAQRTGVGEVSSQEPHTVVQSCGWRRAPAQDSDPGRGSPGARAVEQCPDDRAADEPRTAHHQDIHTVGSRRRGRQSGAVHGARLSSTVT